ncbi:MAG TPA: hypothetical protein VN541_01980, partial [Tepidisphaeraceae bacterium]|nr:hypothetical protein [Tepidisphaeraceae bacterium]
WSAVAEKFSPFNIDVTTVAPEAGQHAVTAVIGGNGQWAGGADGGLSVVGSFAKGPATVWVFSQILNNGDPTDTADVIAHESGHAFGLVHQSVYNGTTLVDGYNPGNGLIAPIMGDSYNAIRALWWDGTDSNSASQIQDDMAIIAGPANGFGYRPQDHGQSIASADTLTVNRNNVSGSGVIEQTTDADFFSFQTSGGRVSLQANVAQYGAMLHLKMVVLTSKGKIVATEEGSSLGQSFKANLKAGTYYVEIESFGAYGDVGQYTITGTIPQPKTKAKAKPAAHVTVAKSHVSPAKAKHAKSPLHNKHRH